MIAIISYLPNNNIRTKRIHLLKRLLGGVKEVFPKEKIYIVAQNYVKEDFEQLSFFNVLFLKYKNGIGVASARNVILEKFYNSNEQVLFLADDDTYFYNYYNITEFLHNFYFNSETVETDLVISLSAQLMPFKQRNIDSDVENYFTLVPITRNCCPNMYLMKNIKKLYDKEIYYKQELIDNNISEDIEFLVHLLSNNLSLCMCLQWIKSSPMRFSTLCRENELEDYHKKLVENLCSYVLENYHKDVNSFFKNQKIKLKIRREHRYQLKEKDYPVARGKKIEMLLFE